MTEQTHGNMESICYLVHKPLTSMETFISRKRRIGHFSGIFKSRMKKIDSSYKLIELLSGRRGSADTVVNVATEDFRFWAVVLIEKLLFNVAYD